MSATYPTPWTFEAKDDFEDWPIRAANGEPVLVRDNGVYPPDLDTCREIVEAVNWYCDWGALSSELERLRAERDRLRDIVRRLVRVAIRDRETLRYIYSGVEYATEDDDAIGDALREARAAIGEDK